MAIFEDLLLNFMGGKAEENLAKWFIIFHLSLDFPEIILVQFPFRFGLFEVPGYRFIVVPSSQTTKMAGCKY